MLYCIIVLLCIVCLYRFRIVYWWWSRSGRRIWGLLHLGWQFGVSPVSRSVRQSVSGPVGQSLGSLVIIMYLAVYFVHLRLFVCIRLQGVRFVLPICALLGGRRFAARIGGDRYRVVGGAPLFFGHVLMCAYRCVCV